MSLKSVTINNGWIVNMKVARLIATDESPDSRAQATNN